MCIVTQKVEKDMHMFEYANVKCKLLHDSTGAYKSKDIK